MAYLFKDALLGIGQVKRQAVLVEVVKVCPYLVEHVAFYLMLADKGLGNQLQLYEEQLFKFQAELCPCQQFLALREMYVEQRRILGNEL